MTRSPSDPGNPLPHSALFLARAVIFGAALASVGLMLSVADLDDPIAGVLALGFAAWVAAPYLLLFHASLRSRVDRLAAWLLLLAAVALAAFGITIYYDAMYVHLDPQSGIVFFVIPLWQLVAAGLLSWWLARRAGTSRPG